MKKMEIEVSQEHTDFEDVQNATEFERVLAEFIRCVQNQDVEPEPLAYGRATNTEIIGYIEEGTVKVDIFTAACADRAIFRASYNCDPENPYWDIFELNAFDISEYGEECKQYKIWEHRYMVDDTKEATCYEVL